MIKLVFTGTVLLFLASATAQAFTPQVFAPSVAASVHDEPVDGLGDSFNASPFEGLIRTQSTRADRAIQEYDVSSLSGQSIQSATLSGRVAVNNSFDNGVRTFDFVLYSGNGTADLSDYQISGTVVGSGQYHPPTDSFFTFNFDVSSEVGAVIAGGATSIGLRVEGTSSPSFPNILVTSDSMLDVVVGTAQVSSFCAGDGSGSPCPCGNLGAPDSGCANSVSTNGASIASIGTPSVLGAFNLSAVDLGRSGSPRAGEVSVPLVVLNWTARSVHWNVLIVAPKSVPMSIGIGHEPRLEHAIR